MIDRPNYITPAGFVVLRAEYELLFATERPALVETITWAAGNGDRSENGDYIYGRKRLREIDRRLGFLAKRMKAAKVIDPAQQQDRSRVWFGATVTIVDGDARTRALTLVGDDETDAARGLIGWHAPLARALRGAAVGDLRRVTLPGGEREYEVTGIAYPAAEAERRPALARSSAQGDCPMAENPRTTSARDHDDHKLIDAAIADSEAGAMVGSSGGHLQTDIGTQDDLKQGLGDSGSTTRPEKVDDIANNQAFSADRR